MTETELLHKQTDRLNAAIVEAEAAFKGLGTGVFASVVIQEKDNLRICLTFEKFNDTWQFCLRKGPPNAPADFTETQTLRTSSRELRILAATYLPDLRHALRLAVAAEHERVEKATAAVEKFTKSLLMEKK